MMLYYSHLNNFPVQSAKKFAGGKVAVLTMQTTFKQTIHKPE